MDARNFFLKRNFCTEVCSCEQTSCARSVPHTKVCGFQTLRHDDYMKKKPLEQKMMLETISERFKNKNNVKLIEFGAGTGRFTKLLIKKFPRFKITVVEPDKNCCLKLEKLTERHKNLRIVQSTAENFSVNQKFDVVTMATAFHHISFDEQLKFLKMAKNILDKNGIFVLADNFIGEYKSMKERNIVLKKSINKWIRDVSVEKDAKELKMAMEMKLLVFQKDFGGEHFICNSKFEELIKKSGLKIKEKINTTNTDPLDMEIYFYLITL
ncbi:class I SAM-dependent methyltransferase [Candidatus Pacearchaeota archaeon]|nr:class I SAM-dependent methyltransferase [Candidatus Pacearchaeota archaeon]